MSPHYFPSHSVPSFSYCKLLVEKHSNSLAFLIALKIAICLCNIGTSFLFFLIFSSQTHTNPMSTLQMPPLTRTRISHSRVGLYVAETHRGQMGLKCFQDQRDCHWVYSESQNLRKGVEYIDTRKTSYV